MSLLNYMDDTVPLPDNAFFKLFNETLIHDANELILPNRTSNNCYRSMFENCTTLRTAPELPSMSVAINSY